VALLPFENLTADPQLDWVANAVPGTLALQLATARDLNVVTVSAPRDIHGMRATRAVFGYFTQNRGRLKLAAELRDVAEQKTIKAISAEGDAAALAPLIDRIALELDGSAQPVTHRNESAMRDYWTALASEDAAERRELLRRAIAADPAFAPAHLAVVQLAMAASDEQATAAALEDARRVAGAFTPFERARLGLLEARVHHDGPGTLRNLTALTQLTPANDDVWRSLGELELSRRNFAAAATALERSLESDGGSVSALNSLSYTRAYMGDLEGARRMLARYAEIAPGDANVPDTLGDVHFHLGRFAEAEKYYLEAHRVNPALLAGGDLYRAALAAHLAGDRKGADAHFANWLAVRKAGGDPLLVVREAVWEASTGRLAQARTRLRQLLTITGENNVIRIHAAAQLALFDKVAGEKPVPPVAPGNAAAAVTAFVCQPDVPVAEWTQRAQGVPAALRGTLLGYALLLNGHFAEAVPLWRTTYQSAHPATDSEARVMFAWSLAASGQAAEAAQLLARTPLPGRAAEPGLTFLTWSKYSELARR
jgi:tetratricopeptide (TPR) repeat protein